MNSTVDFRPLAVEPLPWRKYLRFFFGSFVVWLLLAWVLSGQYVNWKAVQYLQQAHEAIEKDIADVATGLERNLSIFHGVPSIISRDDAIRRALVRTPTNERKKAFDLSSRQLEWIRNPELNALSYSLAQAVRNAPAFSVIWVMDEEGYCIAASNSVVSGGFVGVNYSDREYFKEAREGREGRQFAVGRVTQIPGLFFSAPVFESGKFLGVVAVKIDLPYLSSWVNQTHAFVSDIYDVVIQAQDRSLELHALPDARVNQLSPKERIDRYQRKEFPEVAIKPWREKEYPELFQLSGHKTPFLMQSREIVSDDLVVTVLQPVEIIATRSKDRRDLFFIASLLGLLLIGAGTGGVFYLNNYQRTLRYREHQRQIEYLASHDALTGLFSRAVIDHLISQGIASAARSGRRMAVLFMDLDMFKDINDSMGHEAGDLVLREVATRLQGALRASDPVIRHGGDEFVIILNELDTPENAAVLTGKLLEALGKPFVVHGVTLNLSASIGVALYPDDGDNSSLLLSNADSALYRAKANGRSDFSFYHASMNAETMTHLSLGSELREALIQNQFVLHYQPQYSLSKRCVVGCEALVRWQHPVKGLLLPGEFLGVAEKSGFIVPLGEWVIREVCRQSSAWRKDGLIDFPVAINLSAVQLRKSGLVEVIRQSLEEFDLPPNGLELELTESAVIDDVVESSKTIQRLKELGVSLSIDDFGTGYSSLAYLKRFEPDNLKIDRSFVRDVETDTNDLAVVNAIIGLGQSLEFRVIAEGIETESQARRLERMGCDEIQGYFYCKPLPAGVFAEFIRQQNAAARLP